MLITGYRQAYGRDPTGRRVHGWRFYGLDRIEGVVGEMSTSVFLPENELESVGPGLIGMEMNILTDHLNRIHQITIIY